MNGYEGKQGEWLYLSYDSELKALIILDRPSSFVYTEAVFCSCYYHVVKFGNNSLAYGCS